jgi:plastin-1
LNKLPPEHILIRWVNFHLKESKVERRIANLGGDLSDSYALLHVLNRLDADKCSLEGLSIEDLSDRAQIMISNS